MSSCAHSVLQWGSLESHAWGGFRGSPQTVSEKGNRTLDAWEEGLPAQPRGTQTSDGLPRLSTHDPCSPQVKAAGEISPAVTLKKK